MVTRRTCLQSFAAPLIAGALPNSRTKAAGTRDCTTFVNIAIGTGGHGHTYPGATVPFGAVQLSPDTYTKGWDWCSGYHRSDSSIMGFSHTHLSGTGIGDMLDILLMPGIGDPKLDPGPRENPGAGYRSRFWHDDEHAEPGYYSVLLKDGNIKAELSATERAGIHRYTFPRSDSAHFIIDLAHGISDRPDASTNVSWSELKALDNTTIVGGRRVNDWAKGRHIYFAMKFSKPFDKVSVYGKKAVVFYKTAEGEAIYVKTGISGVSVEGATKNLDAEIADFNFEKVRANAHEAWSRELGKIQIETDDANARQIFYSALYHTMVAPTLFDDVDGFYRGMDGKVHQLPKGAHNYSTFSLWDTYRALHPLYTLMHPERVPDLVNCLIRMAEESPEGMPVWPLQGVETGCMTGYHSAVVIAEAQAKGFKGIDFERAYSRMRKRAMEDDYRGLGWYRKLGYIPCDKLEEAVSKTLEYAYDDWAVGCVARGIGAAQDAELLTQRSRNYRNLFDKETKFMRPRLANGDWAEPFDPKEMGHSKRWRDFTECNSWQATFLVQHNTREYIELFGGPEAFVAKLDALFNQSSELPPDAPPDIAGLVGQYAHGNEPSHHIAYLYAYAGAAHKTQARVRSLLETMYQNTPDGLAGNEDCGQMSAWYVISALGFYAVDPASGDYVFGSPLFDKATVNVGAEEPLTIEVKRGSAKDPYIQSVLFNGTRVEKGSFSHASIANGGRFVFEMSATPNPQFGNA